MKEIIVNVDNYNENSIKTIEGDNLSEVYKIYICKNKRRIDLTNKIAVMAYVDEYGSKRSNILNLNITNAAEGEIELPITNIISEHNGVYACQVAIYGENNSLEQTAPFSLIVENNIFSKISNTAINSTDFHILSEAIKTTSEYAEKLKEGTENIELQYANKLNKKANEIDLIVERNRIDTLATLPEGSTTGDAELIDARIGANGRIYSNAGNSIRGQFKTLNKIKAENIKAQIDLTLKITLGRNYGSDGSFYVSYGSCEVGEDVEEIIVTGFSQGSETYPCIIYLDSENNVIDTYYGSSGGHRNIMLTVPDKTKTIIVNGNYNKKTDAQHLFYPSLRKIVYNDLKDHVEDLIAKTDINNSPLYKKSISWNGDSIMFGQGYAGGFAKIISERYSMLSKNIAVSGGIIAYTSNPSVHSIGETVLTMDKTSEYIICEGGYNDYIYKEPLGEITLGVNSEINNKTIIGGMEQMCRNLLERFPGKKIGFIFTHKIKKSDYTPIEDWNKNGKTRTFRQVHDSMIEVLRKYSIPFLDLYNESCFNTEIEYYLKYTDINDGIHPNEEGYSLFYVDKIIKFLESL